MSGIKKKFISGVIWEGVGRYSALGIQFVVTIIIARILTPADFGVIGLLTVFIALGQIFLDSGFSQALIQKKDTTEIDLSSVFFLNMILGIGVYLLLYILSPFVAEFYNIPELTNYSRILFLIIPINSFGLVQNVIIQKELAFKKTATASVLSAVISGVVGVVMAYNGYGIWSLIGQQITLNFSRTLLYILQRRWLPIFIISLQSIREMFGFSMNLMFHSIVNVTMKNIYALVIGKFYPVAQVGYYNQANKFEEVTAASITQIVLKVSFPALVQKKDEPKYLREAYSKIFSTSIYLVTPLMFCLMVISEPLFRLLLTEKWLPAVPYFKILCLYGMILPILQISYNLYKLFRKGKLLLIIDSLRHILVIISILFTINYSIDYMLWGLVIATVIMTLINLKKSGDLISISMKEQIKIILPYYITAAFLAGVVFYIPKFNSDFFTIGFKGIVFFSLYIISSKLLKFQAYTELVSIIKPLKRKLLN